MRSTSMRKYVHINAGDLGSILAVCAGQNHFGELHMRTNAMHVGPHMNAKGLGSS